MFNSAHASQNTDTTVYPDPMQGERKDSKKRKVENENGARAASVTENSRYNESVHANAHLLKVHEFLKAESEQLGVICVSGLGAHCL